MKWSFVEITISSKERFADWTYCWKCYALLQRFSKRRIKIIYTTYIQYIYLNMESWHTHTHIYIQIYIHTCKFFDENFKNISFRTFPNDYKTLIKWFAFFYSFYFLFLFIYFRKSFKKSLGQRQWKETTLGLDGGREYQEISKSKGQLTYQGIKKDIAWLVLSLS